MKLNISKQNLAWDSDRRFKFNNPKSNLFNFNI